MVELPGASHLAFATAAEAYLAELVGRVETARRRRRCGSQSKR